MAKWSNLKEMMHDHGGSYGDGVDNCPPNTLTPRSDFLDPASEIAGVGAGGERT